MSEVEKSKNSKVCVNNRFNEHINELESILYTVSDIEVLLNAKLDALLGPYASEVIDVPPPLAPDAPVFIATCEDGTAKIVQKLSSINEMLESRL